MSKKVYMTAMLAALVGLTACGNRNNKKQTAQPEAAPVAEIRAVPADCDPEEGYIWSAMNEECVKLFEKGISFVSAENPDMSHVAYVLFSADSTKAELYLPDSDIRPVLDRRTTIHGPVWNVEDDDTYNVRHVDGKWSIERRGQVVYMHTTDLGPLQTRFQGSDGVTRRLYWVDATFYPEASRATIRLDDKTYELKQYVTGSGYGYRNAEVDLRGKGYEATLDFTDENVRDLKLKDVRADQ